MDYQGVIIEESLDDISVLQEVNILSTKIELVTEKHQTPWLKQWTLHTIEILEEKADEIADMLAQALEKEHPWYADFHNNKHHFVIYRGKVFKVELENPTLYKEAKEYGISLGIPEYQVDFSPEDKIEVKLLTLLQSLKPEDWDRKATATWTVKDVVAHMVGWERESYLQLKKSWESKTAPWFMETDDYDDFNARTLEEYKNFSSEQLLQEWMEWQKKSEQEVERIGEGNLRRTPYTEWYFEEDEGSHYKHHYDQIKAALEK